MRPMRRTIETSEQLGALVYELGNMRHPFTVTIARGKGRSLDQNALAWKWAGEIAAHLGDRTANDVWAYNKLHHGVPLLREHDEEFRAVYDERIRPLAYEAKLALMAPPIDLPVTRRMTTPIMTAFIDAVFTDWNAKGVALTQPEE